MLSVKNIESYYGPIAAIKGLTMEIRGGKITVVLGANGAGKTTLLKTISGAIEPQKGELKIMTHVVESYSRKSSTRRVFEKRPTNKGRFRIGVPLFPDT